ncbi:glycosyltransferase [Balneolaceae bacterium ANBcel3]|nr:glycosyltransferase [Balneolaceae bacterium ANBcel3]
MANLLQVKAMCKAMSDNGMNVTLSLPGNKPETGVRNPYSSHLPYNLHLRKPLFNNSKINKYLNFSAVRKAIKQINPDLIYLRSPLLLKQVISTKKTLIVELHNNTLHQRYSWLDNYWKSFLCQKAKTDQIKKVVCISEALSQYWIDQGIPAEKIVTAHDGIDAEQFANPMEKEKARDSLGLAKDKKIVTYLGRLYENRKIDNVLKLAQQYRESLFLVVGGPDESAKQLKEVAEKLNLQNVVFTGQVPHETITQYLYASDVMLALWSSEVKTMKYCSPLKLFEYMGAGRIIVAHGFPTILEVLKDKKNALICKPESIDDLIKKTGTALSMTYPNELAEKAREDVFENYTWAKRTEKIFSGISTL